MDNQVCAYNEWDKLEEVIVGSAVNMCSVEEEPAMQHYIDRKGSFNPWGSWFAGKLKDPKKFKIVQYQLDNLALVLKNEGITVHRPEVQDWEKSIKTPFFECPVQYGCTCPRDVIVTIGNEIIETPMAWRSRFFEFSSYRKLVQNWWKKGRCQWMAMPKCLLPDSAYRKNYPIAETKERDECVLKKQEFLLMEDEPIMEAADIMRFGKDVFIQKSHVTNFFGIEYLKKYLEPKGFRVHPLQFNKSCARHMDDTFCPLKPYFALLANPFDFLYKKDKELFKKNGWKIVNPPDTTLKIWNSYNKNDTRWCTGINCNCLSISEDKIVIDEDEKPTIKFLEDYGFKCIPVPIKNCVPFGGSVHCCTVDIKRKGKKKSYFKTLDELEEKKKQKIEKDKEDKEDKEE